MVRKYKIGEWHPKEYEDNGKTLLWGKDLTEEQINLMEDGEIFTLLDEHGEFRSNVLMDSYGMLRRGEDNTMMPEKELSMNRSYGIGR